MELWKTAVPSDDVGIDDSWQQWSVEHEIK